MLDHLVTDYGEENPLLYDYYGFEKSVSKFIVSRVHHHPTDRSSILILSTSFTTRLLNQEATRLYHNWLSIASRKQAYQLVRLPKRNGEDVMVVASSDQDLITAFSYPSN
jgi:hypothetical protein